MAVLPIFGHRDPAAAFAYRRGRPVSVAEFNRDVRLLAQRLPDRPCILNLCSDRYQFAVGFAAALLRGQVSLLPPNYTADFVARLGRAYPGFYCLGDGAANFPGVDVYLFSELMRDADAPQVTPDAAEAPTVPAGQCAALVFTSGSTGDPVPHRKSWGGLVADGLEEAVQLGIAPQSGLAVLGTVPPQHMYGLETTVLMPMLAGLALVADKPFYPADICARFDELPVPRALVTTPVHLRALLAEAQALPAATLLVCATAPLAVEMAVEAEARFAAPLYEIYGCTEAGQVASRRTAREKAWRLFSGIAMRHDVDGRVWVQGGHVEIAAPLADVIEQNPDGTFVLHGRTSDVVNIGGKRTSLQSLNHHLNAVPGVRDGVYLLPEEDGATARPMAFVVAPNVSGEVILTALRTRMDAVFLPRPLVFVEALPRNSTGKLTREAVRELARQHASGPVAEAAGE